MPVAAASSSLARARSIASCGSSGLVSRRTRRATIRAEASELPSRTGRERYSAFSMRTTPSGSSSMASMSTSIIRSGVRPGRPHIHSTERSLRICSGGTPKSAATWVRDTSSRLWR